MTMDEVKAKLAEELPEEMDSAVSYHQMALAMEEAGCKDCVFVMAIAKDEMTHARWIHDFLHDHAHPIPEEVETKYQALYNAHKFQ